jgi:hypothetical protein
MKTLTLKIKPKFAMWATNYVKLDNADEDVKIKIEGNLAGFDCYLQVNGRNIRVENGECMLSERGSLEIVVKKYKGGKLIESISAPKIEVGVLENCGYEAITEFGRLQKKVDELTELTQKLLMALTLLFKGGKAK